MSLQSTMTTKLKAKSAVFVEYSNLIKELEQYMPQFKASIKDLHEPSQSFVTNFYTDVFSEFFCDVNNLTEIQVTQNLTYNEMYSEIVPVLNMCTALKYIYSKLGIDDFGLNDICDPNPKRTYRLLQTMINFIKYSDQKINKADAEMKAIKKMKDTFDKMTEEKNIIVTTINQKSLDRKQRESEIKTLIDDVKTEKAELMNIQKQRDKVLEELSKVKKEQDEIEKTCAKLCELKELTIREINTLRAQIVEKPDILKADQQQLKRMKSEVTEKKTTMMAQVSAKKQTVIILEQELAAQEKRLRLLTDVTKKNKSLFELTHKVEIMLQEKNELIESSENLKEKIEFIERDRADIKNKINCIANGMEQEHNLYNAKYDVLQKEIDDMMKQKAHQCEIIKSLDNEINKLNLRKTEIGDEVDTIVNDFREIKKELIKKQTRRNSRMLRRLQEQ